MAVICRRHASIDLMAPWLRGKDIPYTVMGEDRWQGVAGPRPGIALSTIHASQGMQWRDVWILDAADHVLPGHTSLANASLRRLPEERRLFFVASTQGFREPPLSLLPQGRFHCRHPFPQTGPGPVGGQNDV